MLFFSIIICMDNQKYVLHALEGQIETIYLAVYPDKILLLDGGCRCDVRRIRHYVRNVLGRTMDDISLIFVSHTHPDHAGAAPVLRRKYGTPIAAHRNIDSWYQGVTGWLQHLIDYLLSWSVVIMMGQPFRRMWYPRTVRPDHLLDDGAALPRFEDWMLVATPGHTAHHSVLYNNDDGTLYVADMVLNLNGRWHPPFPVTMPKAQKASLDRLSRLAIKKLLLAHGGISESFPPDLFRSLMHGTAKRPPWTFRIVMPLTMLPPDIRKYWRRDDYE